MNINIDDVCSLLWDKVSTLKNNDKLWIGLAGIPGSGKSTASFKIRDILNEKQKKEKGDDCHEIAVIIPMDGYHIRRNILQSKPNGDELMKRRGAPFTFDPEGLLQKIKDLKQAGEGYAPDFNHGVGDPDEDAIRIGNDHKIVILEGLYILLNEKYWREITEEMDILIYMDCSLELCRERLTNRHMEKWNISIEEAEERINRNDILNAKYILSNLMESKIDYKIDSKN